MKDGHIVVIAGVLIFLAIFGFSYYAEKSPSPTPPEKQTSVRSVAPTQNTASGGSAAAIEQAKNNGDSMWLLFRSTTCASCVEMQKIFDQLQPDYKGKVHFIAIDVNDKNNIELIKT